MFLEIVIKDFFEQAVRNRVVFCRTGLDEIQFVNVGLEMARLLNDHTNESDGFDLLQSQILSKSNHHNKIGKYLALENIGILFEPELKLNIRSIFENYSKDQCLIVKTEAEIKDDKLCQGDFITVDLKGISYIVL